LLGGIELFGALSGLRHPFT